MGFSSKVFNIVNFSLLLGSVVAKICLGFRWLTGNCKIHSASPEVMQLWAGDWGRYMLTFPFVFLNNTRNSYCSCGNTWRGLSN